MSNIREKQRKHFNAEIKIKRRDYLQEKRQETLHQINPSSPLATVDFSLCHLDKMPNSELLKSKIIEWSNLPIQPNQLYTFLSAIESQDVLQQHFGLIGLRRILSQKENLPIQEVMDHPIFIKLLGFAHLESQPHIQLEATWCLANMASGTTEQTFSLIQKNIISVFSQVSQSIYPQIAEQAIWGLGNIAGDCLEFRNKVLKSDAIEALLRRMQGNPDEKIKNLITWVFSNVCRLKPSNERFTPLLKRLLVFLRDSFSNASDPDLKNDCLFGLYSNVKNETADLFGDSHFLNSLLLFYSESQAMHGSRLQQISAVHTLLGGFTSGDNKYGEQVINCGFLPYLKNSLYIPNPVTTREVCWIFSNLAIGEPRQVHALLVEPMLIETISKFTVHSDVNLAREANWMMCNLCLTKDETNIRLILEKGVLQVFKNSLEIDLDSKMTTLVLEALHHLLEFFKSRDESQAGAFVAMLMREGLGDCLEKMQYHKSDLIYLKVQMLLEMFFPLDK